METNSPLTLIAAVRHFEDSRVCIDFVKRLHWPDGKVTCPRCESTKVKEMQTRQLFKCYACKRQFSVKVGTIFEQSPLPLSKWLIAMWLIANAKNGISSCEIGRAIGVGQKTAWFLMHRIRTAMANKTFRKLAGVIEADESFMGGSDFNRHANKKRGAGAKTVVFGAVERGGNVIAKVVDAASELHLKAAVRESIERESVLYTDQSDAYNNLGREFYRDTINHSKGEYVRGDVHTNSIESYWALFKRTIKGTYIHTAPFHLDRYLSEQAFRFDLRKSDDSGRFHTVADRVFGQRLTWKELTGTETWRNQEQAE